MSGEFSVYANGRLMNRVDSPAIVYDKSIGRMMKIGEFDDMLMYWQVATTAYREAGFDEMADDLVVFELPRTQEALDNVMDNDGYYGKMYYEMYLIGDSIESE